MIFVNHAQKFKWLLKRMLYVKVDSWHLDLVAKGLACTRKWWYSTSSLSNVR